MIVGDKKSYMGDLHGNKIATVGLHGVGSGSDCWVPTEDGNLDAQILLRGICRLKEESDHLERTKRRLEQIDTHGVVGKMEFLGKSFEGYTAITNEFFDVIRSYFDQ